MTRKNLLGGFSHHPKIIKGEYFVGSGVRLNYDYNHKMKVILVARGVTIEQALKLKFKKLKFKWVEKFKEWVLIANPTRTLGKLSEELKENSQKENWMFDVLEGTESTVKYYQDALKK